MSKPLRFISSSILAGAIVAGVVALAFQPAQAHASEPCAPYLSTEAYEQGELVSHDGRYFVARRYVYPQTPPSIWDDYYWLPSNDCSDEDGDGIPDPADRCPQTAIGEQVGEDGCANVQVDRDGDGVCDPNAASTGPSGCSGLDNCPNIANPDQLDDDGDGIGNACDSDSDVAVPWIVSANNACYLDPGLDRRVGIGVENPLYTIDARGGGASWFNLESTAPGGFNTHRAGVRVGVEGRQSGELRAEGGMTNLVRIKNTTTNSGASVELYESGTVVIPGGRAIIGSHDPERATGPADLTLSGAGTATLNIDGHTADGEIGRANIFLETEAGRGVMRLDGEGNFKVLAREDTGISMSQDGEICIGWGC